MKYIHTLATVPVLAVGIVLAGTTQASAREINPEEDRTQGRIIRDPGPVIEVDDTVTEALQGGASAIGGAGIALAALWAYRRRHPVRVH
jgi:hypothetical protein